jgi:IMP dehydrogenase
VDQYERVEAVLDAGADVIVIDTSHGHSENVLRTVRTIKERWGKDGVEVIAGNIATAEGARALAEAGADAVKAGIGPGSICTTRVVTGVGVPQLTAVFNALAGVRQSGRDVPVIADGGIRQSGDIAKAVAAGASCVMLGSLFAGLEESPGELVISGGRRYKSYRGMGSAGAMEAGAADRYAQHKGTPETADRKRKFVPEGVEGLVPYRGTLAEFVYQMVGGLRASMGYCGCRTVDEFRAQTRFVRVTGATVVENHPHDIRITKESPNYSHDV